MIYFTFLILEAIFFPIYSNFAVLHLMEHILPG